MKRGALTAKVLKATMENPLWRSKAIAELVGCEDSYVRTVWQRAKILKRYAHGGRRLVSVSTEVINWAWDETKKVDGATIDDIINAAMVDHIAEEKAKTL